ncbi:hypothetical protein VP01_2455g1 [Puccinia sorghi]|uniref:Uncharacterized protein n=1 Tax=Puccinia sorghi TaxID=27349 RepID=A0A0L6V663_9BASI|nr:hypothetical protein VP01_2455g1 [Puccinia sorghi]
MHRLGEPVKILINFQIFAPTKTHQKKMQPKQKLWGTVKSSHAVHLSDVRVETIFFEEVQSLSISSSCDGHLTGAGSVIKKKDYHQICISYSSALCEKSISNSSSKHRGKNADSEDKYEEELNTNEWATVIIHMKNMYLEHMVNVKYNCHTLIFIDPAKPKFYILLSTDDFPEWSKDGISLKSPLNSILFINQTRAKGAHISRGNVSSSRGIHENDQSIKILLKNGFHFCKVFNNSSGCTHSDIKDLGLTLSFVTMLFDNMSNYESSILEEKKSLTLDF